jgi:hypothetical protein
MLNRIRFLTSLMIVAMPMLAGCGGDDGPPLAVVKGKVTLFGRPYTKGLVTFTPEGGGPTGTSPTDANGDYEIWSAGKKGAAIGKHKISVTTIKDPTPKETPVGATSSDDPAYAAQAFGGGPAEYATKAKEDKEPIPAKYNSATELVKEVTSGTNTFDLELK